jgi:hypothetical protein
MGFHAKRLLMLSAALLAPAAFGAEAAFERTLNVTGPVNLEVDTDSGSVAVRTGATGSVVVKGIMRTSRSWRLTGNPEEALRKLQADPPIEQAGGTIRIGTSIRPELQRQVSISYDILVPVETRLRAHSDSGGLTIEGVRGPVEADADSGSIRLANIGADVRANTDSGRIEADGIQGSLSARSDSGGIRARGVAGTIDASADSGGIQLQQSVAAPINAGCDSGSITVELANAGYDLSAETDSGGVNTHVPLTVSGTIKRNRVEGQIRGGGPKVRLESDSGSIHIR